MKNRVIDNLLSLIILYILNPCILRTRITHRKKMFPNYRSDKGYDGENSRTAIKDGMDRDTHSSKTGFSNKCFRDDKNSFYH